MIQKTTKSKVMKEHGTHAKDTGSAEVQIALFTEKIFNASLLLRINSNASERSSTVLNGEVTSKSKI